MVKKDHNEQTKFFIYFHRLPEEGRPSFFWLTLSKNAKFGWD